MTNPGDGLRLGRARQSDDLLEPGGFGLMLVDRMASRWGIERTRRRHHRLVRAGPVRTGPVLARSPIELRSSPANA